MKKLHRSLALNDPGEAPVEPEVVIHQVRVILRRQNVKSLEKVHADLIGKESQRERTSLDAYQDSENNYKDNLW